MTSRGLRSLGTAVTGITLGSPDAGVTNFLGGQGNILSTAGAHNYFKAASLSPKEWKDAIEDAKSLGAVGDDTWNIYDMRAIDMADDGGVRATMERGLNKATGGLLKTGFQQAEVLNRAMSAKVARVQLGKALQWEAANKAGTLSAVNKPRLRAFKEKLAREGIDFDKLVTENNTNKPESETGDYVRKMTNLMQGSYQLNQVPAYINSNIGRLLWKYQKFNTQQMRLLLREYVKPLSDALSNKDGTYTAADKAYRAAKLLNFLSMGALSGTAMMTTRYWTTPAAQPVRFVKALTDGDGVEALAAAMNGALYATSVAGTMGMLSMLTEGAMWAEDQMEDDIQTRNFGLPLLPAGLTFGLQAIDMFNDAMADGDPNDPVESGWVDSINNSMKFLRIWKNFNPIDGNYTDMYKGWLNRTFDTGVPDLKRAESRLDSVYSQQYLQQFLEETDFKPESADNRSAWEVLTGQYPEYKKTFPNLKKEVREAVWRGEPEKAREILREATKGVEPKERRRIENAIKGSMQWYHPLRIDIRDPRERRKKQIEFIRWMKATYPEGVTNRIVTAADEYEDTLRKARLYMR